MLREYYSVGENRGETLSEVFDRIYIQDSIAVMELKQILGEDGNIYFESPHNDEVIIIGQASLAKGINSEFVNYSGQKGEMQVKGVLTREGIKYERQN